MSIETIELEKNLGLSGSDFPRVIRRDLPGSTSSKPRVVSWIGNKIEKAVDGLFGLRDIDGDGAIRRMRGLAGEHRQTARHGASPSLAALSHRPSRSSSQW